MTHRPWLTTSLLAAICCVAAGGCAQHRVATSFTDLEPHLKKGQTIYLTDLGGAVRKGRLEALAGTEAEVTIAHRAERIQERDTRVIAVPEPLWQGAVVGAVIGAALGSLGEGAADFYDCAFSAQSDCNTGPPVEGIVIGAGLGAAIGAGIDALLWKRTTIFASPGGQGPRVVLLPLVGPRAGGLRVTARF